MTNKINERVAVEGVNKGEIDLEVMKIMPQEYYQRYIDGKFLPSTNIAHAWEVVEKSLGDPTLQLDCIKPIYTHNNEYIWHVEFYNGKRSYWAREKTAPLAICKAALKAKEE